MPFIFISFNSFYDCKKLISSSKFWRLRAVEGTKTLLSFICLDVGLKSKILRTSLTGKKHARHQKSKQCFKTKIMNLVWNESWDLHHTDIMNIQIQSK